uniref:Phytocyanin domain-containing protein n=1 Tax=Leersia perrieri TaxID=77586 RepID=A0A0D9W9W9_9ORYZ
MTSALKALVAFMSIAVAAELAAGETYTIKWALGVNYSDWSSTNTVLVGDSIVFAYGWPHTVDELPSAAEYEACSFAGGVVSSDRSGNTTVTFDAAGTRYFACAAGAHCRLGQKVAITAFAAAADSTAAPSPSLSPNCVFCKCATMSSSLKALVAFIAVAAVAELAAGKTYTIKWAAGGNYGDWASKNTVLVGDSVVFTYGSPHTVDELSAADYKSCSFASPVSSDNSGSTTVTFDAAGTRYFACASGSHCSQGQKVAITVSNSTTATTPASPSSKGGSAPRSPPSWLSASPSAPVPCSPCSD